MSTGVEVFWLIESWLYFLGRIEGDLSCRGLTHLWSKVDSWRLNLDSPNRLLSLLLGQIVLRHYRGRARCAAPLVNGFHGLGELAQNFDFLRSFCWADFWIAGSQDIFWCWCLGYDLHPVWQGIIQRSGGRRNLWRLWRLWNASGNLSIANFLPSGRL